LYFLDKNNILYKNGIPIIDNGTLFALTLLIAESRPDEMEIMKQIVISVLNAESKTRFVFNLHALFARTACRHYCQPEPQP